LNRWIELFSAGKLRDGKDYQCAFYGGALLARTQFTEPVAQQDDLTNLLRLKRVYLGEYNSPKSRAAFDKIIADWEAAHAERTPTVNVELTLSRLAYLFLKHAETEYRRDGKATGETANFRQALHP
jgi:hypothetical protein